MHGPPKTAHAITPIEGAGKEHVLGADENRVAFGVDVPVAVIFATHKQMYGGALFRIGKSIINPLYDYSMRLLNECAHRQTVDEAAWPGAAVLNIGVRHAVPEPGRDDGSGFAQAGRNVDQQRLARAILFQDRRLVGISFLAAGKAALVFIRIILACLIKKFFEVSSGGIHKRNALFGSRFCRKANNLAETTAVPWILLYESSSAVLG